MSSEQFDEDYFLRGRQSGKSLYEDYRWLPELTMPMVWAIVSHLGIKPDDTILDFGCARGYTVKAFRKLGYNAKGVDISEWAIRNADEETKPYLQLLSEKNGTAPLPILTERKFDWIIAKDVLEHIPLVASIIDGLIYGAGTGIFVVVPLSAFDGSKYVVRCYEKDITHIHRLTLATWAGMFVRPGWRVECSYRVNGVKDNYSRYPMANGFIVARRIEE